MALKFWKSIQGFLRKRRRKIDSHISHILFQIRSETIFERRENEIIKTDFLAKTNFS